MNNMSQLINILKNSGNPQKLAMDMLKNNSGDNPMLQNILNLANDGDPNGQLETIARNICKSRNIDADELMKSIKSQFYSR